MALLGAGDREGALAHLAARIDRSERMVDLKIDPRMRPLFGDPAFEGIAGEVGLGA